MADESNQSAVDGVKSTPKVTPTSRPKVGEGQENVAAMFADLKGKYLVIDVRSGHNPMNQGEVQFSVRIPGVEKANLRAELEALPKQVIGLQARLVAGIVQVVDTAGKPVEPKQDEKDVPKGE